MADRLAGLLQHYSLSARVIQSGAICGQHHYAAPHGYLHLIRRGPVTVDSPLHEDVLIGESSLLLYPRAASHRFVTPPDHTTELLSAEVNLGASAGNPLAIALPPMIVIPLSDLPGLESCLELLFAEAEDDRCGRQAAIDRLCELLLINLLRHLMDRPLVATGLLAGFADSRLARAISAMHDAPGNAWSLETLAMQAGMSRARFSAVFKDTVGITPGDYLVNWRINLSCSLLKQGKPVAMVADRVGYGSPTGLARAFRSRMGCAPREWLAQLHRETPAISPKF